ncbi:MAG: PUA domain-containing protein [Sulfolobales archaeon]
MGDHINITKLRKKDTNQLKQTLITLYPKATEFIKSCEEITLVKEGGIEVLVLNETPAFTKHENTYIPTLLLIKLRIKDLTPKAVVDEGAVKHLINGADVMAPGIIEVEQFNKDEIVSVWEPKKETPIVIGKALTDSKTIKEVKKGKAIKNLHHAGDQTWNLTLKIYTKQST